jgi:hypothetical protein
MKIQAKTGLKKETGKRGFGGREGEKAIGKKGGWLMPKAHLKKRRSIKRRD